MYAMKWYSHALGMPRNQDFYFEENRIFKAEGLVFARCGNQQHLIGDLGRNGITGIGVHDLIYCASRQIFKGLLLR